MTVVFAGTTVAFNVSLWRSAAAFWKFGVKMREQAVYLINSQVRRCAAARASHPPGRRAARWLWMRPGALHGWHRVRRSLFLR